MRDGGLRTAGAAALTVALLSACSSTSDDSRPLTTPSPTATPTASALPAPTRAPSIAPVVLAISVDGLNPEALMMLGPDELPTFARLMSEGSSTLDARTAYELTITLPNHTGMLTGRRVDGEQGTSVTFNDDDGRTLSDVHGSYVPGMFDVAHDRGVRTAMFAEKDKFRFLVRSWDRTHGADDVAGNDDGRDKIDAADIAPAAELVDDVIDAMRRDGSGLIFWHLSGPDAAGHADGWLTRPYLDAVEGVDRHLGEVLAALDADPQLAARTTIILTADHGGPRGQRAHSDDALEANYRIPFVAWGRGVATGADLYALDPARADPGNGRPGYTGAQPVRNLDVADTALRLLGLPELPDAPGSPVVLQ